MKIFTMQQATVQVQDFAAGIADIVFIRTFRALTLFIPSMMKKKTAGIMRTLKSNGTMNVR